MALKLAAHKISSKNINRCISELLLMIFVFNTVFLPYDNFGLKKGSFIFLILLNIRIFLKINIRDIKCKMVIMFSVFLTTYTIIKSALLTGNIIADFLSGYTGYLLLLYFVIVYYDFDFCKLMAETLTLLAWFMVVSVCLDTTGIVSIFDNRVLKYLYATKNMTLGKGNEYLTHYYLFIKTTPMLHLALAYLLERKKYISTGIVFLALLLSGTRANILVSIVILIAGLIWSGRGTLKKIVNLFFVSIGAFLGIWRTHFISYFIARFQAKRGGDTVRSLTLESMLRMWKDNPISLIIGQGYTSSFYNAGREAWVIDAELSYWNLLRRVGFLCFLLMMMTYIYPIIHLLKKHRHIIIVLGFIGYLLVAYTNPLLYTSTGAAVLLFMYCIA